MTLLLGLDIGTSGVKAILCDKTGTIVALATASYPNSIPQPLWSEQNPYDWWRASIKCIQALLSNDAIDKNQIVGIGLTGQMHGLVLLDEDGDVLRPAILWNDQRTGEQCRQLTESIGFSTLLKRTGNPMLPGFTAPKIAWVREHEPNVYADITHLLLPKDYIRYRLTGELATEVSDASGTSLFDVKKRTWSPEMFAALDIPLAWAPKCSESIEITGAVHAEAAKATGLPLGLPVVGGGGDQAAQAVGMGLTQEGMVSATIGTSGVVFAPTSTPVIDPHGRLHSFCHAIPGMWHVMGVMLAAGGSLQWFRDRFCQEEIQQAQALNIDPYELILEQAQQAPLGSEGLFFLPYLSGERTPHPDPLARGAFIGLTTRHGKAHFARAIVEGISYGLLDSLELIRENSAKPAQIRASGGGARSVFWRKMLADMFQSEIVTVSAVEGAAFGAALLAGVGTGVYPDVPTACNQAVQITGSYLPITENIERYRNRYLLYRDLYPTLMESFKRIANLAQ